MMKSYYIHQIKFFAFIRFIELKFLNIIES